MTIKQAIEKGAIDLKVGNVDTPKMKARLLMQYVLNQTRQYIIVHDMKVLNEKEKNEYFSCINKLRTGIPIEHITHQKEFMKLNFFVNISGGSYKDCKKNKRKENIGLMYRKWRDCCFACKIFATT